MTKKVLVVFPTGHILAGSCCLGSVLLIKPAPTEFSIKVGVEKGGERRGEGNVNLHLCSFQYPKFQERIN